jgi:hypothetical protein
MTFTDDELEETKVCGQAKGLILVALLARMQAAESIGFQVSLMLEMHNKGLSLRFSSSWKILEELEKAWLQASGKTGGGK